MFTWVINFGTFFTITIGSIISRLRFAIRSKQMSTRVVPIPNDTFPDTPNINSVPENQGNIMIGDIKRIW